MTGPHCHLWNGSLAGILHTQSVTVTQWAIWCATPAATAISSLQTPCNSSMTYETAPSVKWVTQHPASREVSGIVTPRLLQRPLERTWLPSSCAPTQRRLMPCLDRPTAVSSCSQRWKSSNLSRPTRHSYRTSISTIFFFNCAAHLFAVCWEEPVSLFSLSYCYCYTCFSKINVWLSMAIDYECADLWLYTGPALGKLIGGPSGPLLKKVCQPLL